MTVAEAMLLGQQHEQAGNLAQAEASYRNAVRAEPQNAVALYRLGTVCLKQGSFAEAALQLQAALQLAPDEAGTHSNLGIALAALGLREEAVAAFRRAVALVPGWAYLHANLGNALRELGRLDEAIACLHEALRLDPAAAATQRNLGLALEDQGKVPEAAASFRRLLQLQPQDADTLVALGRTLAKMGAIEEALRSLRQALLYQPAHAEAHNVIGVLLAKGFRPEQAVEHFRAAVTALRGRGQPADPEILSNLGNAFRELQLLPDALAALREALRLNPDCAHAHHNLGTTLGDLGQLDEAIACFRRALEIEPDYAEAANSLGNALKAQGQLDDAVASFQGALAARLDYVVAHSNLLCTLQYRPGVTLSELADVHAEFERRHCARLSAGAPAPPRPSDPERPLRLGFVSPDFGLHPIGYFIIRALENLDRHQCAVICYSDRRASDAMTARFQAAATTWREVQPLPDAELAEQIRTDRIDILVDLTGHTAKNRLLVFARKPAPLQVTWLGYVGTTGLSAMDYVIADRWEIPEGAEAFYREKPMRLPDGYICFDPPADAPEVGPLPARRHGHVTFGCFNNPVKVNPALVAVWAEILERLPQSRLVLKYMGYDSPGSRRYFEELFSRHDVDRDRVELLGGSPHTRLLAEYHRIDLALDPFPYSGCLTTCEALWMGVPVITLPGETFAGRHSLSHVSNAGITGTVARDPAHYVDLAVECARDLDRLAAWRAELRERVATSPLCDGPRFADNLLKAFRGVWRRACHVG
jgi:predicted O-linked N-acetylglucosamine transferase (SPINDLY family)